MIIEMVKSSDLSRVLEIERSGFSPANAGSKESFVQRIQRIPETFLVARDTNGIVQGFIVGPATNECFVQDSMFADVPDNLPSGGHQLILSLAVAPEAQRQHIGSRLLHELEFKANYFKRETVSLTCLEELIPFYERNGYLNQGLADSTHGNERWYNMVKQL